MYQYAPGCLTTQPTHPIVKLLLNNYRFLLLISIAVFPAFKTQAQDFFPQEMEYGVHVSADYELPGKNLKDYKATVSYGGGFVRFLDRISVGVDLSYREFAPKIPVIVQDVDAGNQSTTTFSNNSTFLFYLSGLYHAPLTERVNIYGGLNLGMGYNTSSIHYRDDDNDLYLGGGYKQIYVAPKAGISLAFDNYVDIDLHASYNLFLQSGNTANASSAGLIGVSPTQFSSIGAGVGLVFKF